MRNLRAIFRLVRRAWRRRSNPPPETRLISSIDPREFSDLLASGREQDMKTLAGKLSEHARTPQANAAARPAGRTASNSKDSGMAK
jgi:hypothetical protein